MDKTKIFNDVNSIQIDQVQWNPNQHSKKNVYENWQADSKILAVIRKSNSSHHNTEEEKQNWKTQSNRYQEFLYNSKYLREYTLSIRMDKKNFGTK